MAAASTIFAPTIRVWGRNVDSASGSADGVVARSARSHTVGSDSRDSRVGSLTPVAMRTRRV